MKSSKLIEIFQDGNIVIPMYLLKNYHGLNLELNEFVFLMYLYNKGNHFLFNPNLFAEELSLSVKDAMNLTSSLTDKGFITVEVLKNEKGFMEEVVLLDNFYQKLKMFMIDEINQDETKNIDNSSIYEMIEKKFGRTLSSIEYEIIRAWLDNHFSEELIKEAVKEAVFNGVSNLKYIDKILYEWSKKGVKTPKDVEELRHIRKKEQDKNKESDSELDLGIMDWDWFDEDE